MLRDVAQCPVTGEEMTMDDVVAVQSEYAPPRSALGACRRSQHRLRDLDLDGCRTLRRGLASRGDAAAITWARRLRRKRQAQIFIVRRSVTAALPEFITTVCRRLRRAARAVLPAAGMAMALMRRRRYLVLQRLFHSVLRCMHGLAANKTHATAYD